MGKRLETVRAKIGATVLDVMRPGWYREVDTAKLDLGSCEVCVLGQLFGGYATGAESLFAMRRTGDGRSRYDHGIDVAASEAGFALSDSYGALYGRFDRLTEAWKREIRKRIQKESA